jgi:hypothetical protein
MGKQVICMLRAADVVSCACMRVPAAACMQAGSVQGAGRGKVEITVIDVTGTGYRQCPVTGHFTSTVANATIEVT